jgi:hypothetical protein
MARPLFLMELVAYAPLIEAAVTLRYSSPVGFITGPAETPANTLYEPRLLTPMPVKRDLFDSGATSGRSRIDYGDVELLNGDGALDALLTYGYGRAVTIRKGTVGAAYPAGFTTIFDGTAIGVEGSGDRLRVKLRSGQLSLEQPFQTTKYAGNNSLPAGLEGVAEDLKGKPKPVCLGTVLNVAPPQVNTSKLIYQVSDGAVQSVDAVYDAGRALATGGIWTIDDGGFGSEDVQGLVYGAGLYVAVGTAGTLTTSADGDTWTSRTSQFGASIINAVAFNGSNLFVAVGASGKVSTSSNGTTWTAQGPITGTPTMRAVVWASELSLWVAVGNSAAVSTSPDGITWTNRTSNYPTGDIQGVSWNGSILVAVGNQANVITSIDGITWTNRSVPFGGLGTALAGVAYGSDRFIAVGTAWGTPTQTLAAYSMDGLTWQLMPQLWVGSSSGLPTAICYGASQWLVVGTGDRNASSRDGISWTAQEGTTPYSADLFACCYGTTWLVGGNGNTQAMMYAKVIGYANSTDLLDDALAPRAGEYTAYLAGGYIRLGSPPFGQVTADVTQGANAAARTAGQLFAAVLTKAGKSAGTAAGNWLAADVTALDSANAAVLGDWISEEEDFASVIDRLANSVGAWWGLDRLGRYRIVQFTAPSGSPVATITANDMKKDSLVRVTLAKDGISNVPTWRTKVRYGKNYTVQTSGLAGAVSDDRRAFLAQEYREVVNESASVQTAHVLAVESVYDTLMASASAAATEASRLQTLRGTLRHCFDVTVPLNDDYATVDLNDLVTLTHPRYSLSAGVLHRVIGVSPDSKAEWVTLRLWR